MPKTIQELFCKLAALDPENRRKLFTFWAPLYGEEYARAMTEDHENKGKKVEVAA